jgi:hypothetical protein
MVMDETFEGFSQISIFVLSCQLGGRPAGAPHRRHDECGDAVLLFE